MRSRSISACVDGNTCSWKHVFMGTCVDGNRCSWKIALLENSENRTQKAGGSRSGWCICLCKRSIVNM